MQSFFSLSPAPVLPAVLVAHWGLLLGWGLVLAWLAVAIAARFLPSMTQRTRWWLVFAVLACNLLPDPISPAYWLGLAFQAPSLMLVAIALHGLWAHGWKPNPSAQVPDRKLYGASDTAHSDTSRESDAAFAVVWCVAGVLLGWVLLLDTLAFWPRSVYALGFGAGALVCAAMLLALGAWRWPTQVAWMLCAVLLVFASSRLPNGNLWDALLDPLLWAGLHIQLLRGAWTALRGKTEGNSS